MPFFPLKTIWRGFEVSFALLPKDRITLVPSLPQALQR